SHHAASRLPGEPANAKASGGDLRLVEDRGDDEEGPTPRLAPSGLELHPRPRRVQPRSDTEPERDTRVKRAPKSLGYRSSSRDELLQVVIEGASSLWPPSQPRTE